jgi:hypothetical protein
VKIYVTAAKALRQNERGDETQLTTKIDGKTSLSLGPSYFVLCKISFPVKHLTPYYAETGHFRPLIA